MAGLTGQPCYKLLCMISVVIPTYRRPENLKLAVQSVLNQTFQDFEIIVVDDDRSGDKSIQNLILDLADDRVRYAQNVGNKGANGARNTGIGLARGEWISFLDDDDLYEPRNLEVKQEVLKSLKYDSSVILFSDYAIAGEMKQGKDHWTHFTTDRLYYPASQRVFDGNFVGPTSLIMVNRDKLLQVGLFDETLPSCQDWDLYIRLALNGNRFVGINEKLMTYISDDSIPRITTNTTSKEQGLQAIYSKFLPKVSSLDRAQQLRFHRYIFRRLSDTNLRLAYSFFWNKYLVLGSPGDSGALFFDFILPFAKKVPMVRAIYYKI